MHAYTIPLSFAFTISSGVVWSVRYLWNQIGEGIDYKVISNCKSLSGENSFSMRCLYAIACEIKTVQTRNTLSTVVIGEGITLGMTKNRL